MRSSAAALVGVSLVALLAGCTIGPDYVPPKDDVPKAFGEVAAGASKPGAPVAAWWTTFRDPVLDRLIARAAGANLDLRRAAARVRQARAALGVAESDLLPTVDVTADASRSRTSGNIGRIPARTSNLFRVGFDAMWELDVFGGTRREVEAADAAFAASVEDSRDVLVTLLAEVARVYVDLRGAQRRTVIAQANLAAQRQTLEITRSRLEAGLASDLDVARAQTQVETTAASIPTLEIASRQSIHALSVLLALPPQALVPELQAAGALPAAGPEVPVGLPSELLRRRPDVRRAERELAAANARIGAAEADWFPRLSLTGALGRASDDIGDLFDASSRTTSLGGAVRWPILDFGRISGNVDLAEARTDEAAFAYRETVLTSLREVEDALVALSNERARQTSLAAASTAAQRAVDLANQLWRAGRTDFLAVLESQRDLFAAQDSLVDSERRTASDLVALYKALGGGWDVDFTAPLGAPAK